MTPPALRWGLPLAAAAAVFAAFQPALAAGWLNWDDYVNFVQNQNFRGLGGANLAWMFTNTAGHYMPLTWMTLGLDYELWGMNAAGYHFTNVLLHAVNTVLCFFLLTAFLGRLPRAEARAVPWAALAGALLYGLHPLRVESVAWITERRDVVAGLFFIPAVLAYLKAMPDVPGEPPRRKPFVLSIAFFACSLLSKTIGLMLPFALLVLDVYPLRRLTRTSWKPPLFEKTPFFALMLAGVVLTGVTTAEAGSFLPDVKYDLAQILTQPVYKLSWYAWKSVVPTGLNPVVAYRPPTSVFELRFVLAAALVLGLTAACWASRRKVPALLAAWAAFAFLLAPVLSPLQAGPHVTADRYTYLASLVLSALAAAGLAHRGPGSPALRGAVAAAVLALLGVLSWTYCGSWRDSETLWTRAIRMDPGWCNNFLYRGLDRAARGKYAEAIEDYNESLRLVPRQLMPLVSRSSAKMRLRDLEGASRDIEQAISWAPTQGPAYRIRGDIRQRQGRLREAEEDYSKAISFHKTLVEAWFERGALRGRQGRFKEAVEDCTAALQINPFHVEAYVNRALGRGELGDLEGAVADYEAALRLQPSLPEAWGGRGMCLALAGQWARAAESFERALGVASPDWPFRADTERRLEEARARRR
jgi:protein O-mannosyl-transferase